jgi:hypothetical protein
MGGHTEDRGFIGYLQQYLDETPALRIIGHTLVVCTWALIALFLFEGYTRVRNGEHLVDSVIADFNMLNTRHLEAYTQTQKVIEDLLNELLRQTNADRAMLVLLHNGKNSVGGVPFLSVSGYAEAYRQGMSAAVFHLDGVPLTVVSHLQETLRGDVAAYRPNETREGDAVESIGVDRIFRGPVIRSFDGVPHGWIFLGYNEAAWMKSEAGRAEERRLILKYTDIMTGILNSVNLSQIVGRLEDG